MSFTAIQSRISTSTLFYLLSGVVFTLLLSGCASSSGGAQVVDRNGRAVSAAPARPKTTSGQYRVRRGDTLYSIAFRFGWDWKALAARNHIVAPYTIRVGQIIRFDGNYGTSKSSSVTVTNVSKPRPTTTTQPRPVAKPAPVVTTPATTKVESVSKSASGWAWPAQGTVIGRFSSNGSLNKGIDIAGNLGEPILAASDGSVVYAGSGLRGYGELVIIKHSDTYVSAYGHNRKLLVREGQRVKVGQRIAEMGSTGTDRVKLHFEIRRQGKPVDPLQFLPKR